ncbi:MAG: acyltransferase [Desulfocapsa sp.]|nr:acyltransferase [Desulfocapsa sp.]
MLQNNPAVDIPHKNNFDLLRLLLALNVFLCHLGEVSWVKTFFPLNRIFNSTLAVDCFFVVSGFLIFRSFDRSSSTLSYLDKRVRRIYPAYVTAVLMGAFLLPWLTGLATDLYFSHDWLRYLFSNLIFLNFLQPTLPEMFVANNMQVINAPLWTIKVEVMFYLSVPLIFLLLKRGKKWLSLFLLYSASIAYSLYFLHLYQGSGQEIYLSLEKQLPGQLAFFLGGGAISLYYAFFSRHAWKFILLALLILTVRVEPVFSALFPLGLSILVLSFALLLPYLGNWGKFGDLSYGVYIYHFPILQLFTHFKLFDGHPWSTLIVLLFTILFTAFCSYHLIERPFLHKSSHYRQAAEDQ